MKKSFTVLMPALTLALLVGCSASPDDSSSARPVVSLNPGDSLRAVPQPPIILRAYRSSGTASPGQVLTFDVVALDPNSSALSFSWEADTGLLGPPADEDSRSHITWTAPSCVSPSTTPTLTITITNAFALTTSRSFPVSGLPACAPSGWASAGSMSTARYSHTTTLLPDGTALVVGGVGPTGALASAELYDPVSGTWSTTGSMAFARSSHTATLLPDGRVLVTGGSDFSSSLPATAELYDPASGTWSPTGSMVTPRHGHTATLLPDGKVLVTGGLSVSQYLAAAEIYDPASGTWSATEPMGLPRYGHTATLLSDGKVLVTGGGSGIDSLSDAELYDPVSGTWSPTGSMPPLARNIRRRSCSTGRCSSRADTTSVDPPRRQRCSTPASGTWNSTGSMAAPRSGHTVTRLSDGQVLATGGFVASHLATAEVDEPVSGTWSATESMASPRYLHTATLLSDGRVLVAGGLNTRGALATAELYSPP